MTLIEIIGMHIQLNLDLPQVDCEMRDETRKARDEVPSRATKSRVDLFRLRNIEFNLHTVGAKKLGVT